MSGTRRYQDVRPVRDIVTDDEAYEAMVFIDETAGKAGDLEADAAYFEYMIGAAEAVAGLYSDERSAERRKWEARTSAHYLKHLELFHEARRAFLNLRNKREAAKIKVELYRTLRADKRAREVIEDNRYERALAAE